MKESKIYTFSFGDHIQEVILPTEIKEGEIFTVGYGDKTNGIFYEITNKGTAFKQYRDGEEV